MHERRRLAALLVRSQAMLWSAEDPVSKARIQRFIQDIERQLLALDEVMAPPRYGTAFQHRREDA